MKSCDTCGNHYDKCFDVVFGEETYTFDCFECAIHELAPECMHCGCKIIGHGVEAQGKFCCCVHCAKQSGIKNLKDRS